MPDPARRAFRIRNVGLVFQEFELLDYLNLRDNILLPYRITPFADLRSSRPGTSGTPRAVKSASGISCGAT